MATGFISLSRADVQGDHCIEWESAMRTKRWWDIQVLFWVVVLSGGMIIAGKQIMARHTDSNIRPAFPTAVTGPNLGIVQQDQKNMGMGDGSIYNYVTIKNTGTSLVSYVGVNSTCTNDAGTVVGTGYGNTANVGPGEQTVVTVSLFDVDDCTHIRSDFDSLTR